MRPDELLAFTRMTGEVVRAMRESPVPVIAAIHGTAAGAGSVLALASDFRVMTRSAKFAFLFTKVGLAGADMGAAYLLPRLVGLGRATQLLMLGDTLAGRQGGAVGAGQRAGRGRPAAGDHHGPRHAARRRPVAGLLRRPSRCSRASST